MLNELGYNAISLTGWQAGIYTNNTNQNALIENIDTTRICKELENRNIVIITGFQGYNSNLDITTLGRGGSDTSAVAVAAALNAKHCYIFSDVDGVYTTDPNKILQAQKLETLSYVEMLDISNEGAKVLHNRCVEIGEKFNIPIITQSTFNNKAGSIIHDKIEDNAVKSIVKNDDLILVNLRNFKKSKDSTNSKGLKDSKDSFNYIYKCLIKQNIIPIKIMNNSDATFNVDFLIKSTVVNKFQKVIETELNMFDSSFKNISRIAVIGSGITYDNVILQKFMNIIDTYNLNIFCIDVSDGKIAVTFIEKIENAVLELLHEKLFEI